MSGKNDQAVALIKASIAPGTLVYTDEYDIYARLEKWGYGHQSVCHGGGDYMRVTTMATDSMKRLSTRSKGCGLCYALGSGRTVAFLKTSFPCIWDSSSSFITRKNEARLCWRIGDVSRWNT
jgi:transposase